MEPDTIFSPGGQTRALKQISIALTIGFLAMIAINIWQGSQLRDCLESHEKCNELAQGLCEGMLEKP